MSQDRTTRELLNADHLAENRREYWVERGAWVVMLLIVVAAALGGLGPGPMSRRKAESPNGTLRVQYEAMDRYQAPSELHITWIGKAPPAGPVEVSISRPLVDRTQLTQVTPPPGRVETRSGAVVLTYDGAALAGGQPIIYRYQHEHFGPIGFEVTLVGSPGDGRQENGGQRVRVTQFVWP
jgi:hypothetical protein